MGGFFICYYENSITGLSLQERGGLQITGCCFLHTICMQYAYNIYAYVHITGLLIGVLLKTNAPCIFHDFVRVL